MSKFPALTAAPRALVQRRLAALCGLLLAVSPCVLSAQALGPAFTYQGELRLASGPATANFDMQFRLYSAQAGGSQIGATVAANNVAVSGGLFAVPLDFGPEQFAGERQWQRRFEDTHNPTRPQSDATLDSGTPTIRGRPAIRGRWCRGCDRTCRELPD